MKCSCLFSIGFSLHRRFRIVIRCLIRSNASPAPGLPEKGQELLLVEVSRSIHHIAIRTKQEEESSFCFKTVSASDFFDPECHRRNATSLPQLGWVGVTKWHPALRDIRSFRLTAFSSITPPNQPGHIQRLLFANQ